MRPADNEDEARRQAERMVAPGVAHFHDAEKRAGKAIAEAMGAPGRVAWHIYMIFAPGAQWGEEAPRPRLWVHQLIGAIWANPLRYRTGKMLKRELSKVFTSVKTERAGSRAGH